MVAQFEIRKDYDTLIAGAVRLCSQSKDYIFLLIGHGTMLEEKSPGTGIAPRPDPFSRKPPGHRVDPANRRSRFTADKFRRSRRRNFKFHC